MSPFTEHKLHISDGQRIHARLFQPAAQSRATVLIAGAMGVPQQHYAALATWLAQQGLQVITFDYRGIGLSRHGSLRGLNADILDWAQLDCAAVLQLAQQAAGAQPLYWIGHSLGGQILPFVPGHQRVNKIITVASGSGYWLENAAPLKRKAWLLWFLVAPLSLRLCGYFPGKRLNMVGDLPAGVMRQWRRWCLNPDYAAGAEGPDARAAYAKVTAPIVGLSFSDDEFMSQRNIESLHGFYRNAPRRVERISPQQLGLKRIGHLGFFRAEYRDKLWQGLLLPELQQG